MDGFEQRRHDGPMRLVRRVVLFVVSLAVLGGVVWLANELVNMKSDKPKKPPKISLLPDRPPPPPPPPKEEKKPEPPKVVQKEVKVEAPKAPTPQSAEAPLKMEGAAGDGPSAFSSGPVTQDYIGGPTVAPPPVASKLMQGVFAERLQRHLQTELNRNRKLKDSDYRVSLRVWIGRDGAVQRAELVQSTGSQAIDELLQQTLTQIAAMREPPPDSLPQPIRIRITARGSG